ncbi:hypothetical protein E2C01_021263 [Portunus trituberculatus]|uniref:Uncharacterized protein n=1 Tax=Portunus trituberculatus TaxID=210409 RepID=A0A5B7E3R7_PORTR|nr:hypothetical protein [Portunus trituberculatus]
MLIGILRCVLSSIHLISMSSIVSRRESLEPRRTREVVESLDGISNTISALAGVEIGGEEQQMEF